MENVAFNESYYILLYQKFSNKFIAKYRKNNSFTSGYLLSFLYQIKLMKKNNIAFLKNLEAQNFIL